MTARTVTTQAELDAALVDGVDRIDIHSEAGVWLTVTATGSATVTATGSATVTAYDSATVTAYGSATVTAYGSATVTATGSATVTATGSATVTAYDSATVRAYDSATVRAYGSATVRATGSATVRAYDSATVRAYDSATVRAYGSATVRATPAVAVHLHSASVRVDGGVVIDVSKPLTDPREWCEHHGVTVSKAGVATLYKAVRGDYMSSWGAAYKPGTKPSADDWRDDTACGGGLHFSPTPWQASAYDREATRWLKVGVRVDDLRPIPGGAAKCKAPRVLRACVEVDIDGNEVTS